MLGKMPSLILNDELFIFSLLQEMERLEAVGGCVEPIYAETIAGALTLYICRRFSDWRARDHQYVLPPFKLKRVKDYVADHLGERLSLADLAALCDLSERHFHRAFKATLGQTPLAYVVQKRIKQAKFLLASTDVSIVAVANAVGFANPGHFARAFMGSIGIAPSAYRNKARVN